MAAKISYTAATLAAELDTDPRTARKFFRAADSGVTPVGKGARYTFELTPTQLTTLKKKFAGWTAAQSARKEAAASQAVEISDAEAKNINVLTLPEKITVTRKTRSKGTKSSPNTKITVEVDDEVGVEDLSDAEFEAMIDEIKAEGPDTDEA